MNDIFYFGCLRELGHFLYHPSGEMAYEVCEDALRADNEKLRNERDFLKAELQKIRAGRK